jgi:hypothetical protein
VGWLLALLAGAGVLYFGVLAALGLRWRQMRQMLAR